MPHYGALDAICPETQFRLSHQSATGQEKLALAIASILNFNLYFDRTMEFVAQQEAAIEALTPDHLLAAMRRHIDPEKISIFRVGDFANKLAR